MRRIKLIALTAAAAAAMAVTTAGAALADQKPQFTRCTEESADKGAVGPIAGSGADERGPGHTYPVCELRPPSDG